jgi:hypothetical protein
MHLAYNFVLARVTGTSNFTKVQQDPATSGGATTSGGANSTGSEFPYEVTASKAWLRNITGHLMIAVGDRIEVLGINRDLIDVLEGRNLRRADNGEIVFPKRGKFTWVCLIQKQGGGQEGVRRRSGEGQQGVRRGSGGG